MPRYDFISQRLFFSTPLKTGDTLPLDRNQSNYLLNVLRMKDGDKVLLFNGKDGEWSANLSVQGRKSASLTVLEQTRPQTLPYDLEYLFAPIKQARMEYVVQKAVEMGASIIRPVLTQFTQVRKLNLDRMRAYATEAAEQCGILNIAEVKEPESFSAMLSGFSSDRHLIFCNEEEGKQNPLPVLEDLPNRPISLLIGPEGGFSAEEREQLLEKPFVTSIPLGPRVLRADTAAVAALAVIQAKIGDWRD